MQPEMPVDFTDYAYQSKLPMHARSTAAKAIKNNLRITEEMADRNVILTSQKVCLYIFVMLHINDVSM